MNEWVKLDRMSLHSTAEVSRDIKHQDAIRLNITNVTIERVLLIVWRHLQLSLANICTKRNAPGD